MHSDRHTLFQALWDNYRAVTPSAERIHTLLGKRESKPIVNDHIALRTFNLAPVGLDALAAHFLNLGYPARRRIPLRGQETLCAALRAPGRRRAQGVHFGVAGGAVLPGTPNHRP